MITATGQILNNATATDFISSIKKSDKQYKNLKKEEERQLIDSYVELVYDENGEAIIDETTKEYQEYLNYTPENLAKKNKVYDELEKEKLWYYIPRKINWKKPDEELKNLLIRHNIRDVFSVAKKYCRDTRDFDDMIAKGLYGLTFAANNFNFFKPILVKNEDGTHMVPKISSDNKIEYIKFITYAHNWIFKYVVDEFYSREVLIDNNSISLNDKVKIKDSLDSNHTYENYVNDMISPDAVQQKTITEQISSDEVTDVYDRINSYIYETNELSAIEKNVLIETYYNHRDTKDISVMYNIQPRVVLSNKAKALKKLKNFLIEDCNINSMNDIIG